MGVQGQLRANCPMIVPARVTSDRLQDLEEQGSCERLGRTCEGGSLRFLVSADVSYDGKQEADWSGGLGTGERLAKLARLALRWRWEEVTSDSI